MFVDHISHNNVFTDLHPFVKFVFFFLSLIAIFFANSTTLIFYFLVNLLFLIIFLRISPLELLKILLPFVGFGLLILVVSPLSIKFTDGEVFPIKLVFSRENFHEMSFYFFRALACVSCMLVFSMTTPFLGLVHVLRLIKIPSVLIDLMIIAYFYAFILLKKAREIYISQVSRLGYADFKTSYRDLAQLIRSEYTLTLDSIKWLYISANSRNFNGEFHFLQRKYKLKPSQIALFIGLSLLYLALAILN